MILPLNLEEFRSEFYSRWVKQWKMLFDNAGEGLENRTEASTRATPLPPNQHNLIRAFAGAPACAGEVRLLAPELTPSSLLPVYVLVLKVWAPRWMLIAPFSRFTVPATPGEFLIQDQRNDADASGVLSTLCLWNAISIPNEVLEHSWLIETCEAENLKDALCVFECLQTGAPLPAEISFRTGAPLGMQRSDPRNQYLREEITLLSVLIRRAFAEAPGAGVQPVLPLHQMPVFGGHSAPSSEDDTSMAFAADDAEPKGRTIRFGLAGREEQLLLTSDGKSERALSFYVLGADGEPSSNLDGCMLRGSGATEPVEIRGGYAKLDGKNYDSFAIQQKDGVSIPTFHKL